MQRSIIRFAVIAGAMLPAACDSPSEPAPPPVVEVSVAPTTLAIGVSETSTVTATVVNGSTSAVTWRSANTAIATVNAAGAITGVAPGTTLVTAIAVADTMKRASVTITVEQGINLLGLGAVTDRYTSEVAVRGDFAYTTSWGNRGLRGNTMYVWNVAGSTPVLVNTVGVANASTTGDVQISDDGSLIVVATEFSGSIAIFDRSNPASPQLITQWSHVETGPGVHTVKLGRVNGRHYAFLSINPGAMGARLIIVDITNPAAPAFVWSERMGTPYVHDVFVRDGILITGLNPNSAAEAATALIDLLQKA